MVSAVGARTAKTRTTERELQLGPLRLRIPRGDEGVDRSKERVLISLRKSLHQLQSPQKPTVHAARPSGFRFRATEELIGAQVEDVGELQKEIWVRPEPSDLVAGDDGLTEVELLCELGLGEAVLFSERRNSPSQGDVGLSLFPGLRLPRHSVRKATLVFQDPCLLA